MKLLDFIFPPRCLGCRQFLIRTEEKLCPACDVPLDPLWVEENGCRVRAVGRYEGLLLDLIVRLKYRGEERLASFLGQKMAGVVGREDFDLVLPIPLHRKRLRERGFNQALLLAREVGRGLKTGVDPFILEKRSPTPPQAALKGEERRKNLKGVFGVRVSEKVQEKKILVVDDVYTTGATIEEASRTLLKAGAKEVEALVLARAV